MFHHRLHTIEHSRRHGQKIVEISLAISRDKTVCERCLSQWDITDGAMPDRKQTWRAVRRRPYASAINSSSKRSQAGSANSSGGKILERVL